MTPKRLKEIKALTLYAREDCYHDDNCSAAVKCIPELVDEIERLKGLVKTAYREAGQKVDHYKVFDSDNFLWNHSEARKVLEQP